MLAILLFSPIVTPIGLVIALWGLRWPLPNPRRYALIVAALSAPLVVLLALQMFLGLPAGSCVERPLNNAPMPIAAFALLLAPSVVLFAKQDRRFALGAALAITPLTLFSAPVTVMSLAGCWI